MEAQLLFLTCREGNLNKCGFVPIPQPAGKSAPVLLCLRLSCPSEGAHKSEVQGARTHKTQSACQPIAPTCKDQESCLGLHLQLAKVQYCKDPRASFLESKHIPQVGWQGAGRKAPCRERSVPEENSTANIIFALLGNMHRQQLPLTTHTPTHLAVSGFSMGIKFTIKPSLQNDRGNIQ